VRRRDFKRFGDYWGDIDRERLAEARSELALGHTMEAIHHLSYALGREFFDFEDQVKALMKLGGGLQTDD